MLDVLHCINVREHQKGGCIHKDIQFGCELNTSTVRMLEERLLEHKLIYVVSTKPYKRYHLTTLGKVIYEELMREMESLSYSPHLNLSERNRREYGHGQDGPLSVV